MLYNAYKKHRYGANLRVHEKSLTIFMRYGIESFLIPPIHFYFMTLSAEARCRIMITIIFQI